MTTFKNTWPSLFNEFLADSNFQTANYPLANILESENNFEIQLAAPGFIKEDFKIEVLDKAIKLSVEKEATAQTEKVHRKEFSYGNFSRTFRLNNLIDTEAIEASYSSGILSITLPKKEEAKPKEPRLLQIV